MMDEFSIYLLTRVVLENPADVTHKDMVEGIYLFTSGVPDQQIEPLLAYIEERVLGTETKIHTVLFNVDDYDTSGAPIPSRYANITRVSCKFTNSYGSVIYSLLKFNEHILK